MPAGHAHWTSIYALAADALMLMHAAKAWLEICRCISRHPLRSCHGLTTESCCPESVPDQDLAQLRAREEACQAGVPINHEIAFPTGAHHSWTDGTEAGIGNHPTGKWYPSSIPGERTISSMMVMASDSLRA